MANVRVSEMVRKSAAVWPRVAWGVLPLAILLLAPIAALGVLYGGALFPEVVSPFGSRRTAAEEAASTWAFSLSGALFAWGVIVSPVLAACAAKYSIRALHGERPRVGAVLAESLRALPSALPLLAAGLFGATGFATLFFPGFLTMALFLPAGAALVAEKIGAGSALSRAMALTKNERFALAGALFVVNAVEGVIGRLASIFTPDSLSSSHSASDMWAYAVIATLVAAAFCVWRAALAAVAYHELRARGEGAEPEAIAAAVGGRSIIGVDISDQAVASEQMGAMQARRRTTVRVAGALVVLAIVGGISYLPISGWLERRRQARDTEERVAQYERELQERRAREAEDKERRKAAGLPEETSSPLLAPPPSDDEVAKSIAATPAEGRRRAMGDALAKRGTRLYGGGFGDLLRKIGNLPPETEWDSTRDRLRIAAKSIGCGDAMDAAEKAPPARAAAAFGAGCPARGEPRAVPENKLAGVPLWAGALAIILEISAKDRGRAEEALHLAVTDTLLAEKIGAPEAP